MPDPHDLAEALSAVNGGNVATGLDFRIEQTIKRNDPAWCYLPFGEDLIRALAASKGSESREAAAKLKAKYGKDFSPRRFAADIAEAKAALTATAAMEQPDDLLRTESGKVVVGHENAFQYFKTSPQWAGVVGFNEFTGGIEILRKPPAPVTEQPGEEIEDVFDTNATRWIERRSMVSWKTEIIHRTINVLARENPFHPVRAYLNGLPPWDGVPRLATWLEVYCGVDPGSDEKPNYFAQFAGRMFFISAVARIMQPGCQVDHMLVWEGKTGIGKSSAAKALVPNEKWFTDEIADFDSKDASQQVRGVWIIELPELDAWTRADAKTAKRFISKREERFRQPYGKRLTRFGRQCVFIGTTEKEDYGSETMRRQWPVRCGVIDVEAIKRDRDQLWAETLAAYKAGERWHPEGAEVGEATREQRKRYNEDVWTTEVMEKAGKLFDDREAVEGDGWVTIPEILTKMNVAVERQDARASQRVGTILRMASWRKWQRRLTPGASPSGVYGRPE